MPVTLRQIADRTGFSRPTVSRILNDPEDRRFPPETRTRVLEAARELGYIPSSVTRVIRTGRFDSIALLLSTSGYCSYLPAQLLTGIQTTLRTHDQHLMVAQLPDSELSDPGLMPKVLREWAVDGMLVNYTHAIPDALLACILEHILPAVWLNSQQETDCVHPDDFEGMKDATEHLIALGHRRILYTHDRGEAAGSHYSVPARYQGYEQAMQAAGLTPQLFVEDFRAEASPMQAQYDALFFDPDPPTALLSYSPLPMQSLVFQAIQRGWRIPEQLALVTMDATPVRDFGLRLDIATWQVPVYEMGRLAVEMLLEKIACPQQPQPCRKVPFTFVPGDTLVPPARK